MLLKTWRFITRILAAFSMGMAFCHTLEMPAKIQYDAALWTTINQSLYWQFSSLPGIFSEVGAVLAAIGQNSAKVLSQYTYSLVRSY